MDDHNFNKQSADQWVSIIESPGAKIRSTDLYPKVSQWLQRVNGKKTLEIGCGQGDCFSKLPLDKIEYLGVDPSPFLIERAQKLNPNFSKNFLLGNVYNLPLEDNSFDSVFSIAVWHLLEDIERASSEMSRILNTKGSFLLVTADPNSYPSFQRTYDSSKIDCKKFIGEKQNPDGTITRDTLFFYSLEEIESQLSQHGFKINSREFIRNFIALEGFKK